jgi:hypothetical protein
MWRDLYAAAADPEDFFDGPYLRAAMDACVGEPPPKPGGLPMDDLGVPAVLTQSAPMAAVLGCPFQGASAPGVFEDEVQLRAMALLADDIGVGGPDASRPAAFRRLLHREGLAAFAVDAARLASAAEIDDGMFALPAVLLAVSRRADLFLVELAGIDLALRTAGLLSCWTTVRAARPHAAEWDRLDLARGSGLDPVRESMAIATACAELGPREAARIEAAIGWLERALACWETRLATVCRATLDPAHAMAEMLRTRSREASAYHHDFELAGRDLAGWLREAAHDPYELLNALASSRLVRPGAPDRSPLVTTLVAPGGPMFRVFSPDDLVTIHRWIAQLPDPAARSVPAAPEPPAPPPGSWVPAGSGIVPGSLREAYYVLQGRALAPRTRAYALDYARDWLERAERTADQGLPSEWVRDGLRAWLLDRHAEHDQEFSAQGAEDLPDRETVIDSAVQLAPLTLIDGAWLLGCTDVTLASSAVGCALFRTYWDELGNGEAALNHPRIYRDFLLSMGVQLPPTASLAFARDERIREGSLRLPVFWLSIGKFPRTFLPEILGLNLAMELSGVGGGYRSARRFLRAHGFSTLFVDLHNTIDNVSTGHSAWAADAIDAYLSASADPLERAARWRRVRVGYASLAPQKPRRRARQGRGADGPVLHHPRIRMDSSCRDMS